ncbi:MAG: nuclear transport factor 2 family protein [Thermoplasmata archaeon]
MIFDYKSFERKFMEGWNYHAIEGLLELYSDDMIYKHQGEESRIVRGKKQFDLYLKGLWDSIPDFEFKLLRTAWNGCTGFGEWIGKGTFQGQRYGHSKVAEPKKIEYEGVDVLILDSSNLIKEERAYYNMLDVIRQLQ